MNFEKPFHSNENHPRTADEIRDDIAQVEEAERAYMHRLTNPANQEKPEFDALAGEAADGELAGIQAKKAALYEELARVEAA